MTASRDASRCFCVLLYFRLKFFKFGPQFSQSLFKQRFLRLQQGTSVIFAKGVCKVSGLRDQRISQTAPGAKTRLRAIDRLARNRAAAVDEAPLRRAPPAAPRGRGLDTIERGLMLLIQSCQITFAE